MLWQTMKDMHRAIVSLMEELEAIGYQQRIDAAGEGELKEILRQKTSPRATPCRAHDAMACSHHRVPDRTSRTRSGKLRGTPLAPWRA